MVIPDNVKVGGFTYAVIVTDEPLLLNGKQYKGLINYNQTTIKLSGDTVQSEQMRAQTFFHELVHALRDSRNLDWGDKDELYTEELGIALHTFFIDNNIQIVKKT